MVVTWTEAAYSWLLVVACLALDVVPWADAVLKLAGVVARPAVAALGRAGPGRRWAVARWQPLLLLPLVTWAPPHIVE